MIARCNTFLQSYVKVPTILQVDSSSREDSVEGLTFTRVHSITPGVPVDLVFSNLRTGSGTS